MEITLVTQHLESDKRDHPAEIIAGLKVKRADCRNLEDFGFRLDTLALEVAQDVGAELKILELNGVKNHVFDFTGVSSLAPLEES